MVMIVAMVMMIVVGMFVFLFEQNIELHGADVRPHRTRSLQFITFDGQLSQLGFEIFEVQTEVEKRPNSHVTGDTGEAVEVQRLHESDTNKVRAPSSSDNMTSLCCWTFTLE